MHEYAIEDYPRSLGFNTLEDPGQHPDEVRHDKGFRGAGIRGLWRPDQFG